MGATGLAGLQACFDFLKALLHVVLVRRDQIERLQQNLVESILFCRKFAMELLTPAAVTDCAKTAIKL